MASACVAPCIIGGDIRGRGALPAERGFLLIGAAASL